MTANLFSRAAPQANGCLIWQRAKSAAGYGQMQHNGKVRYAHRLAYEATKGPIPQGLEIDHLCRNRACINPGHLEAVTRSVNTKRGLAYETLRARNATKTHCPKGHEYTPENMRRRGGKLIKDCRQCAREKGK